MILYKAAYLPSNLRYFDTVIFLDRTRKLNYIEQYELRGM